VTAELRVTCFHGPSMLSIVFSKTDTVQPLVLHRVISSVVLIL
jgi:hypothetical protein